MRRLSTSGVQGLALLAAATALAAAAASALGAAVTNPAQRSASAQGSESEAASPRLAAGRKLYRRYCGQCHALRAARAVGFGTGTKKRYGEDGGPSFDTLRVPYTLSILAVTVPWGGHEVIHHKMTWSQVKEVARYIAIVTKHNKRLAQPIDG